MGCRQGNSRKEIGVLRQNPGNSQEISERLAIPQHVELRVTVGDAAEKASARGPMKPVRSGPTKCD